MEVKSAAGNSRLRNAPVDFLDPFVMLALELKPSLPECELAKVFARHAAEMTGAGSAIFFLEGAAGLEPVVQLGLGAGKEGKLRTLAESLRNWGGSDAVMVGPAGEIIAESLARGLEWSEAAVARLQGSRGELLGVLCLADFHRAAAGGNQIYLRALVAHASALLENARLFAQIEQSRKQWVEDSDAISDLILVHDEKHKLMRVNRALAERLEARPSALIGKHVSSLKFFKDSEGRRECPLCRSLAQHGDGYAEQFFGRTYLAATTQVHEGSPGEQRIVHVLKDVSERREAERRYRELFDSIQEGLFFCTREGKFLEFNSALLRLLGYDSREELMKVNFFRELLLRPEQGEGLFAQLANGGRARNCELVLRRRDGKVLHTLQNVVAVQDAAGKVQQYRGLISDVTEQKSYQAQLQRERDFNKNILNNTQSMILVLDTAGLVSYANRRCFEAGFRREALLGNKIAAFVTPGRRPAVLEALQSALAGRSVDNLELPLLAGEKGTCHFSANLSPMRDEQGSVNSVVVVMTDVTDVALLQAKLRHTEKLAAVGQLVSGVAHEVNNPLAAILGFTDLLLENPEVPETAKKELQVILEQAERTKVIVQDLLRFARQTPAQREAVQVNTVVHQTVKLRAYDCESHGVEVIERFDPDLPPVVGDAHQLQQVFLNILNNACDAVRETQRRGRIELETMRCNDFAEISICDNGPGITNMEYIFDPFFTTKEVGKGTGLGLSICYGIVNAHKGEIVCWNNRDGPGCTFLVRLPLVPVREAVCMGAGDLHR